MAHCIPLFEVCASALVTARMRQRSRHAGGAPKQSRRVVSPRSGLGRDSRRPASSRGWATNDHECNGALRAGFGWDSCDAGGWYNIVKDQLGDIKVRSRARQWERTARKHAQRMDGLGLAQA